MSNPVHGLMISLKPVQLDGPPNSDTIKWPSPKKLDKSVVLYLHRRSTQYQCKDCIMFMPDDERCWIHGRTDVIKPYGTCGLFVKGKPIPGIETMNSVSKLESGYTDESPEGYSCKRCEYFSAEKADCEKVDKDSPGDDTGKIDKDACCNQWEAE